MNITAKIIKGALYGLIFLTPLFFLPLTVAPVETGKQILAIILVLVSFFIYLLDSVSQKKIIYPQSWLALSIAVLIIVLGMSAIFSKSAIASLWGNFTQPDTFISFAIAGLAFFLASIYFEKKDLVKIALVFFSSLAVVAIFGLLQIFGKFILPWDFTKYKNFNTIGMISSWGIFITFGLVLMAGILTTIKLPKATHITLWILGGLITLGLIVINYQFLWITLALAMFILVTYKLFIKFQADVSLVLPLVMIVISLFFIVIGNRFPALSVLPAEIRPNLYSSLSVAKHIFSGKMILLGSGPGTFGYDWNLFKPIEFAQGNFWQLGFNQGFSFIATLGATTGLLGVLALLLVIFSFIRQFFVSLKKETHEKENNGLIIIFSGLSSLIISLFLSPIFFSQIIFIFLGLGIMSVLLSLSSEIPIINLSKIYRSAVFTVIIVLMTLAFSVLYLSGQKYLAAVYYYKGLTKNNLTESLVDLDKAAALDSYADQYFRTLSQALLMRSGDLIKNPPPDLSPDAFRAQVQNTISASIQIARQAISLNPNDPVNWSNLGDIYRNLIPLDPNASPLAADNYKKTLSLDPYNQNLKTILDNLSAH